MNAEDQKSSESHQVGENYKLSPMDKKTTAEQLAQNIKIKIENDKGLEEEISQLHNEIHELKKQVDGLQIQDRTLQYQNRGLQGQNSGLQAQISLLQDQIKDLLYEMNGLRDKDVKLQRQVAGLKCEVRELRQEIINSQSVKINYEEKVRLADKDLHVQMKMNELLDDRVCELERLLDKRNFDFKPTDHEQPLGAKRIELQPQRDLNESGLKPKIDVNDRNQVRLTKPSPLRARLKLNNVLSVPYCIIESRKFPKFIQKKNLKRLTGKTERVDNYSIVIHFIKLNSI